MSQTPLAHTAAPTAAEQTPVSAGVWPGTEGTACPFGSFAVQLDDCVLHHSAAAQSVSTVHP